MVSVTDLIRNCHTI